jgi:ribosomal protein S12 methylthiotransferase accessory factor
VQFNRNNFYYTIPLDKENTLFYSYFKKYLFKLPKEKLDRIISDFFINQKFNSEYEGVIKVLKDIFKKENNFSKKTLSLTKVFNNAKKCLQRERGYIILGKNILISQNIKKLLSGKWRISSFTQCNKNILERSGLKLILGLIYDEEIFNFLEKNKNLLIDSFCGLVGLEEIYAVKISPKFCVRCFRLRRLANQKNLFENIILQNYLIKNKMKYLLTEEQLSFILFFAIKKCKEKILVKNIFTQELSYHNTIIPFPHCSICKKIIHKNRQKYTIIDNKFGIINSVDIKEIEVGKIKFYICTTKLSNIIPIYRLDLFNFPNTPTDKISQIIIKSEHCSEFSPWRPLICGSVSRNRKISIKKAISESIERYCASLYKKEHLVFGSYEDLKPHAVNPEKWCLFNQHQYKNPLFPYTPFTKSTKIYWVEGFDLKTHEKIYLPAPFVFIRYFFDENEAKIGIYPTTGLSCGKDENEILLSGICENIERDACMLFWLLQIPPKRIINIDDEEIQEIIKNFKSNNIDLHLFELSLDLEIPTVLALGINNQKEGPRVLIGSACKTTLKDAILRAIDELVQGFNWVYLMERYKNYNFGKNFENITHFEHRALFYSRLKNLSILNFIFKTKRTLDFQNFKEKVISLKKIIDNIYTMGYDIFYVDLTSTDVKNIGLKVYKVLIPGLQPLNSNHNTPFLDQKRITKAIDYLKLHKIKYSKKINLYPHFFT